MARGDALKMYHLNLLKTWRKEVPVAPGMEVLEREELGYVCQKFETQFTPVPCGDHLLPSQRAQAVTLQGEFSDIFLHLPRHTDLIEHHTETSPGVVVRSHPYHLPEHKKCGLG